MVDRNQILDLLCTILPFIEDIKSDKMYKDGVVSHLEKSILRTIKEIETDIAQDQYTPLQY